MLQVHVKEVEIKLRHVRVLEPASGKVRRGLIHH
jgi:hypothetical protein